MAPPQHRRWSDVAVLPGRRPWYVAAAVVAVVIAGGVWYVASTTRERARDGAPSWSPDGRSLAFVAETTAAVNIYVMDGDGGHRRAVTTSASHDLSPAFSPDGTRIAFESDRDGNEEIYVANLDGRNLRRLTTNPATDRSPAWSPTGDAIVFVSDRDARPTFDAYRMDVGGGAAQRLTRTGSVWAPQYAPGGRRIALQVGQDIHVMDVSSLASVRVTHSPQNGMNPTWSPDGQRVAFVSSRNGRLEIFSMNADGSDQRLVVSMARGSVIDPRWSPDGGRIAFVYVPSGKAGMEADSPSQAIYIVELASGKLTRLSD